MRRLIAATLPGLLLALALFCPAASGATLDQEDVETLQGLVDKAVAKRVAPIRKELAELSEQRVGPTEIAGGIGYLVGLGGMFAYAASRRRKN